MKVVFAGAQLSEGQLDFSMVLTRLVANMHRIASAGSLTYIWLSLI